MNIIICFFLFSFGACIGSFINVIVWRLPREESIVLPRSYCPKCKKKIHLIENIPVLSYLFLKGRCSGCKKNINKNYLLVEVFTGLIFLLIYLSEKKYFVELHNFQYLLLSSLFLTILIIQFIFDLKYFWLPKNINYVGMVAGLIITLLYSVVFGNFLFVNHIAAGLIGFVIFSTIYSIGKLIYGIEVMGAGDIKLIVMIGIWIGIKSLLVVIYLSFLISGLLSIFLIYLNKIDRKSKIPLGSVIIFSTISTWLVGDNFFINIYTNLTNYLY